jgi:hypothetical protein
MRPSAAWAQIIANNYTDLSLSPYVLFGVSERFYHYRFFFNHNASILFKDGLLIYWKGVVSFSPEQFDPANPKQRPLACILISGVERLYVDDPNHFYLRVLGKEKFKVRNHFDFRFQSKPSGLQWYNAIGSYIEQRRSSGINLDDDQ